jgi:hypothetical protein
MRRLMSARKRKKPAKKAPSINELKRANVILK